LFADAEVDRSPTGSGVTARAAKGTVAQGEHCWFESVTGTVFEGEVIAMTRCDERETVTVRVSGQAHYSATARFWLEAGDDIGCCFLLRSRALSCPVVHRSVCRPTPSYACKWFLLP
jgi:trans-L-3-hydroxyproline dehydratase